MRSGKLRHGPRATPSPFSACSMICRRAFFRLLARSISCSLDLKMRGTGLGLKPLFSSSLASAGPDGGIPSGTTAA